MKEHPIPQDITSYRFHIVGSMTLKQFGEVAVGVVICLVIYQTNLPVIIKWPMIAILFGGGLAAAFVPIEERPLSHWLSTFISILYKPTQFFWKRSYNIPAPFLFKGNQDQVLQLQEIDLTPARRQRIKDFISSTAPTKNDSDFSPEEQAYMSDILTIFQTETTSSNKTNIHEVVQKPSLTVRVRSMRQFELPEFEEERITVNSLDNPSDLGSTIIFEPERQHSSSIKKNNYLEVGQVAQTLEVPEIEHVNVGQDTLNDNNLELIQQKNINPNERAFVEQAGQQAQPEAASEKAHFNADLPFPSKPTQPNKLVGMVLTQENELVPGAIVEIKTATGHVSRAVKTNALGQFFITTPLGNGDYVVSVEKDGFSFKPLAIQLTGTIVEPLEVRSS